VPSQALADVLGRESLEVWSLRLSGGSLREVATTDPVHVATREYVFAVPLDVMGKLARKLTEVYERQHGNHSLRSLAWASALTPEPDRPVRNA